MRRTPDQQTRDIIDEIAQGCVLTRTRLVSRVITSIYDQELRPFAVSAAQFALLVMIDKIGPASRAEIGRFNRQDRSTLTRNLKIMLAQGWIDEGDAPTGGRRRPIRLTGAGEALLRDAAPLWRQAQIQAKTLLGQDAASMLLKIGNGFMGQPRQA